MTPILKSSEAIHEDLPAPSRDYLVALRETVDAKRADILIPGFIAEFDPDEADFAGAFVEDAMSLEDALDARFDPAGDRDACLGIGGKG